MATQIEVIVIGAGPAGLTAALYLARYRRDILVIHDATTRAARIPKTHNAPGFPDGIAGPELIDRMTGHAATYGARFETAEIVRIRRNEGGFELRSSDGKAWVARAVILATGIALNAVRLPHDVHEQAIADGVLRYCPVCDGYEHRDMNIGVIGCDSSGAAEALFLRQFSKRVTLLPLSHPELSADHKVQLEQGGIVVQQGALKALQPHRDRIDVALDGVDTPLSFDVVYPALGIRPRSELAHQLGISLIAEGCVPSGSLSGRDVSGFFAAGDVVEGLDQISVAMGHGALAATKAHNWLREQDGYTLRDR